MAEMITKGKEQVRGKSVLLFSGGMDSLIINSLLKPDILLNVSMNSTYDDRERETFSGTGAVVFGNMIDHLGTLSPKIINTFFMLEDFIREGSKKSTGKLESD